MPQRPDGSTTLTQHVLRTLRRSSLIVVSCWVAGSAAATDSKAPAEPPATRSLGSIDRGPVPSWNWPSNLDLFRQLAPLHAEPPTASEETDWAAATAGLKGPELLDAYLQLVTSLDASLKPLVHAIATVQNADDIAHVREMIESLGPQRPTSLASNLHLALARSAAQARLFDETLEVLGDIESDDVVDPSSLYFYRAAAHHHLLDREKCIADIKALLERESELSSRYVVLAKLMQSDIEPLEEDSLGEIARLMNDVHRRLDLNRSGTIVQGQEKKIVDKLDKMIDQIEQQLQQMQQAASQQNQGGSQGGKPMEDSQIAGGPGGNGDVDRKNVGTQSGWGNLPPAQREEALQDMTQELPSHYREIIEAYFKDLAAGS